MSPHGSAARWLGARREELIELARTKTPAEDYSLREVVDGMIQHAKKLGLRQPTSAAGPELSALARSIRYTLRSLQAQRYSLTR